MAGESRIDTGGPALRFGCFSGPPLVVSSTVIDDGTSKVRDAACRWSTWRTSARADSGRPARCTPRTCRSWSRTRASRASIVTGATWTTLKSARSRAPAGRRYHVSRAVSWRSALGRARGDDRSAYRARARRRRRRYSCPRQRLGRGHHPTARHADVPRVAAVGRRTLEARNQGFGGSKDLGAELPARRARASGLD